MTKPRLAITIVLATLAALTLTRLAGGPDRPTKKLYWFIPDGLRAEPDLFQIYRWAEEGKLPNLKRMMERGTYGYSIPAFPSHTPVNFAVLLTGAPPVDNGVSDGPMHPPGYPLKIVAFNGFGSTSRKLPPLPYTLEERGYEVGVLSVPGTTPPELQRGVTLRGRWGGWGVDFPAVIFNSEGAGGSNLENRVFYQGPELARPVKLRAAGKWEMPLPKSHSPARETSLTHWGATLHAYVYDSTDDGQENYDRVLFSLDRREVFADMPVGEWSEWRPLKLEYELQNDYNVHTPKRAEWERRLSAIEVDTHVRIRVIRLGARDDFRVRLYYDNLNEFSIQPGHVFEPMHQALGPMVDFPDSYPAQLVRYPEDKAAFLEEAGMSLEWHKNLARFASRELGLGAIVHNIYTPNQMLTSRWWLGHIDPASRRYARTPEAERQKLFDEVLEMYRKIDAILGEILDSADENTVVAFSSDHGALPLDREVHLNNLFAREGLLKFRRVKDVYEVDWTRTRAVFLKMDGIYLHPNGLEGNYRPASGPEYERLRARVTRLIEGLRDSNGESPLAQVVPRERALELGLDPERVGDLVIANRPGYGWTETMSDDLVLFSDPLVTGYKQGVLSEENKGLWTPFVIMGPGVPRGHALEKPIHHMDQYPTIMKSLGEAVPEFVKGRPVF